MNYETHDLNFIKNDHVNFINDCQDAKERFDIFFPQTSSTWGYSKYNIFNFTAYFYTTYLFNAYL